MMDDKSHREEFRDMYTKFGLIDTQGSMYDDEYDDTYDHLDVSVGDEDPERYNFLLNCVCYKGKIGRIVGCSSFSFLSSEDVKPLYIRLILVFLCHLP